MDVLQVTYTYSAIGKLRDGPPLLASINHTGAPLEKEREEVMMEEHRLQTARMMKEARVIADDNMLPENARNMLVQAENLLDKDVDVDKPNPLIEMLKSELQQLLRLMTSPEIYDKQGRPFALSSETSHDRQRFVARGDAEKLRMFATPRMDAYLEQVKSFVEDPSKPLPTADEDLKQELAAADPLAPIIAALSDFIQTAIQSLESINDKALLVCASVLMVSFLYLYVWA